MKRVLKCVVASLLVLSAVIVFDVGIVQSLVDTRCVIEDGVVGCDYWIKKVDNRPVDRVQHGFIISKVPLALVRPGNHVLQLSEEVYGKNDAQVIELEVSLESRCRYRLSQEDGKPILIKDES
jgi:hypothetical protein